MSDTLLAPIDKVLPGLFAPAEDYDEIAARAKALADAIAKRLGESSSDATLGDLEQLRFDMGIRSAHATIRAILVHIPGATQRLQEARPLITAVYEHAGPGAHESGPQLCSCQEVA